MKLEKVGAGAKIAVLISSDHLGVADQEKLEALAKCIEKAGLGYRRTSLWAFAYAFIEGCKLIEAKEVVGHSHFMKWIRERFQAMPHDTVARRMNFSRALLKFPTVGNLAGSIIGRLLDGGELTEREMDVLAEAIREVMDGSGMLEFMRSQGVIREAIPDGYRITTDEIAAFLKSQYPKLLGKKYEELSEEIKAEARKWIAAARKPSAVTALQDAEYRLQMEVDHTLRALQDIRAKGSKWMVGSIIIFDQLRALYVEMGREMDAVRKLRKP